MRKRMTPPESWADYPIITAFPFPENYPGRALYRFLFNYVEDSGVLEPDFGTICMLFSPRDPFAPQGIERWYRKIVEIGRVLEFRSHGKVYGWLMPLTQENDIDHPSPPRLPLPPWVVWHGKEEFGGKDRHKWNYEILWDKLPSAGKAADDRQPTKAGVPPDAPGELVKYDEGTVQYDLARRFRDMVLDVAPGAAVPAQRPYDLRRWSLVMGLMLESGATAEDINHAIDYIRKDPLWNRRIRTPDNMRDTWAALTKQMQKGRSPVPGIDPDVIPSSLKKHAELAGRVKAEGEE